MIYFDNAATTRIDPEILKGFNEINSRFFANPSSAHRLGQETSSLEAMARKQIGKYFNVSENEVIFTSGATESNNLAIKGSAFKYQNRGKHLITTKVEHPSVLNAFRQLEEFGFRVTYLPVDEWGKISVSDLKNAICEDTILVSVMAVNNEVGTIEPIEEIGKILKPYQKIVFHVDATQSIGKINLDYSNVDLISLSAHKLHGFKGSGLLIKKKKVDLMPLASGGGQEFGLRSGTNNFPYEVSLAKTIRLAYERQIGYYNTVEALNKKLRELLLTVDGVKINSPVDASPFILNFRVPKKASVVSEGLSLKEIYVSTKSACSSKKNPTSYVLEAMGRNEDDAANAIRVSLSNENTLEEVEIFVKELKEILQKIK